MKKNIVITGVGLTSPLGFNKEQFWQNLFEGKSAFSPITLFDTRDLKVNTAGEIRDFNPKNILGEKGLLDLDRATLLLLCAAKFALEDSGLEVNEENTYNIGVSVGTTLGSFSSISKFQREALTEGPRFANPSLFPSVVCNSPASRISIWFNIKGFNATISTGICAGLDAIDYACNILMFNRADKVIAGSVIDLSQPVFLGLHQLALLAGIKGELLSCPFDKRRNGMIFSEGATTLILQDDISAQKENAHIYGEVLGIGSCFDPLSFNKYNPKGAGMKQAMKLALKEADLSPEEIDCVFANANSTQQADLIETEAIKDVFGDYAHKVPITAIKSTLGETLCASGGFAVIAALGALEKGIIPPTINFAKKDRRCNLNYLFNKAGKKQLSNIMINSFDCKGTNTCLIVGRYRDK